MSSLKSAPSDPTAKNAPAPEGMDEDTHDDSLLSDEPLDDASEHKMSQSEMKEADIKDLSAILQTQVTEEHAKTLFDRYNTNNNGTWSPHDLRLFLLDLQEAFGLPRVVPDEALADVLKELQLNIDAPGGVTWVEFKSYLLFLQQKPFEQLSELVQKYVLKSDLPNALLVTSLPAKVMKEHVAGVFANAGSIKQIFLVEERGPQALVIYQDARGAAEGLKLDGTELLGAKIVVVAYTNQDFPATVFKRKPSILAVGVAKAYVAAKNFDDKAKISVTLKQGYDTAGRKLESFAQEHKVKEKAQLVADKTNEAVKKVDERLKISEKASHLNEKYQISQKAAQAQEQAKRVADQVMANENVKAVGSFFSGIASRVQQSYTDFAQDTTEAIAEERRKSNAVEGGQQFPLQDAASAPKPQQ